MTPPGGDVGRTGDRCQRRGGWPPLDDQGHAHEGHERPVRAPGQVESRQHHRHHDGGGDGGHDHDAVGLEVLIEDGQGGPDEGEGQGHPGVGPVDDKGGAEAEDGGHGGKGEPESDVGTEAVAESHGGGHQHGDGGRQVHGGVGEGRPDRRPVPAGQAGKAPVAAVEDEGEEVGAEAPAGVAALHGVPEVRHQQGSREGHGGRGGQEQEGQGAAALDPDLPLAPEMDGDGQRGQDREQEVVVVAQQHEGERQGGTHRPSDPGFGQQAPPQQQEQRNPLEGHQLHQAQRLGQVVGREGHHEPAHERGQLAVGEVPAEPEAGDAGGDEGEDHQHVERLDEAHEPQQDDADQAVEGVHGLAQQRRAVGVVEQVGVPRQLVEDGDGVVDPPQVPDVLVPVAAVGEEPRRRMSHRRPGEEAQEGQVDRAGEDDPGAGSPQPTVRAPMLVGGPAAWVRSDGRRR